MTTYSRLEYFFDTNKNSMPCRTPDHILKFGTLNFRHCGIDFTFIHKI